MAKYDFGIGGLWGVPNTAVPTPVRFGTVKKVSVEFKTKTEKLNGQTRIAVAIGVASTEISGSIEQAEIDAYRFNVLFWGAPQNTGQVTAAIDEIGNVPGSSTYTITVANASFWVQNLSVLDRNTGVLLTKVASGPVTGQYSVASGVYTFAAADANRPLFISYDYSVAAVGANFTPLNPLMGVSPVFELRLTNPFQSGVSDLTLFNCIMTGQKFAFSNENFQVPNLSFECFAGANSQFYSWSSSAAQTGSRQ